MPESHPSGLTWCCSHLSVRSVDMNLNAELAEMMAGIALEVEEVSLVGEDSEND